MVSYWWLVVAVIITYAIRSLKAKVEIQKAVEMDARTIQKYFDLLEKTRTLGDKKSELIDQLIQDKFSLTDSEFQLKENIAELQCQYERTLAVFN
ncbi:hypothetical protein GO755_29520 [Spirosoma sp. HMF4905]|uniref:Uncharacterized protein n=1 Tax=Spirosoma arboris TaxID=2682092 RepID=A0A7K1SK78_9BACT|nr:hypothetical protein [Spirosoma arboris]MVM34207.1 hypothetical protein [Spirosoma arboris]